MIEDTVIAIGLFAWGAAVGWMLGKERGTRQGREEREHRLRTGEILITLPQPTIDRLLERHNLIAMPKGADFRPQQKEPAE